ncbi:LADA_0E14092g1_1 [Lachancea dasiensis]|uniref:Guanine nucleotide-exchange factor SEC12 n=1 Tax=Lachancea dasiensis TaxID=1072105 RepID=A0A1G4JFV2_9SACH|nr:LADA_0E14092g1_1 [Lachancea dasiensis]
MKFQETMYSLGYPAYGARFLNDSVLLVAGGGGEGNNGIANKLTALQVNFDKRKAIKRYRELTLNEKDDSPTTLDAANNVILMGCNESSAKIKAGGDNHHVRKYVFENDHLKFVASVDLDRSKVPEDYTKLTYLSQDGSVAAIASSKLPTVIRILNPNLLAETYEIETGNDVKDLHFSPDGKVLSYITTSTLEVISIVTGRFIVRKTDFDKNWALSKIRFIGDDTVLVAAALRKGNGIVLCKVSLKSGTTSVLKTRVVTTKFRGVTSMDVDSEGQLAALAGNDNSVALVKLKNLSVAKFFKQVHSFAITKIVFSPNGNLLASVSAANTIHVIKIPNNFANATSVIEKILKTLLKFVVVVFIAVVAQFAYKHNLYQRSYHFALSKWYGRGDFKMNDVFRQTTLVGDVVSIQSYTRLPPTDSSVISTSLPSITHLSSYETYTPEPSADPTNVHEIEENFTEMSSTVKPDTTATEIADPNSNESYTAITSTSGGGREAVSLSTTQDFTKSSLLDTIGFSFPSSSSTDFPSLSVSPLSTNDPSLSVSNNDFLDERDSVMPSKAPVHQDLNVSSLKHLTVPLEYSSIIETDPQLYSFSSSSASNQNLSFDIGTGSQSQSEEIITITTTTSLVSASASQLSNSAANSIGTSSTKRSVVTAAETKAKRSHVEAGNLTSKSFATHDDIISPEGDKQALDNFESVQLPTASEIVKQIEQTSVFKTMETIEQAPTSETTEKVKRVSNVVPFEAAPEPEPTPMTGKTSETKSSVQTPVETEVIDTISSSQLVIGSASSENTSQVTESGTEHVYIFSSNEQSSSSPQSVSLSPDATSSITQRPESTLQTSWEDTLTTHPTSSSFAIPDDLENNFTPDMAEHMNYERDQEETTPDAVTLDEPYAAPIEEIKPVIEATADSYFEDRNESSGNLLEENKRSQDSFDFESSPSARKSFTPQATPAGDEVNALTHDEL